MDRQASIEITSPAKCLNRVFLRVLARTEDVFCAIATMALVFCSAFIGAEIISRSLLHKSLPGVYDSIHLLMVVVVFMSLSYTQRVGRHIRVTFFLDKFKPGTRKVYDLINLVFGMALGGIVTWQAYGFAASSWKIREYYPGLLNLPVYPSKIAFFIGSAILTIQFLVQFIATWAQSYKAEQETDEIKEVGHYDG